MDRVSQLDLTRRRGAEAGPGRERPRQRIHDFGMTVPEDQRAPRSHVVEVGVAIDVCDARSLAARDEYGIAAHGAKGSHRRVHAARHQAKGFCEEFR